MTGIKKAGLFLLLLSLTGLLAGAEGYVISQISFEGNRVLKDRDLRKNLNLESQDLLDKILFWRADPLFSESYLNADLDQIKVDYQKAGFLDVVVSARQEYNEEKDRVRVIFQIEEGEPVLTQKITCKITAKDTLHRARVQQLITENKRKFGLQEGRRFTDDKLKSMPGRIGRILRENGYPAVAVNYEIKLLKEARQAEVLMHVNAGAYCDFGMVRVSGNDNLAASEVLRLVSFSAGEEYKESQTIETQRRIQNLGLFQYVTVKSLLNEVEDGQIPIEILVKELPWWSVRTGIGYGLEERFRLSLRIKKLGWLGGARRAEFTIRHSFLEPYHFSLNMIQPAFFTPQASLKLNPYLKREREDAYELESMGLSTTFQRELSGYTTTFISYQFERADLEMKTDVDSYYEELSRENYNKSSVSMGLSIDHSEPAFTPDRGWQGSVVTTLSGLKLGSEYHYWQWLIDLRKYYQVLNGTVMAGRAKLGQMKPLWGDEITPIEERFYAGGSTSLRGWNRGGVGPKNEADIAVGGESYLEFSLELRQHIWKQLYGVIFVDAGNVWSDYNSQNLTDLFYSPGLGIRYETPIGPVRFDAAQPLTGSKKQTMLHLSIGQAF